MILGLFDRDVQSACDEVARTTGASFLVNGSASGCHIHCEGKMPMPPPPTTVSTPSPPLLEVLASPPLADCGSTKAVRALHTLFPFGDNRGKASASPRRTPNPAPFTLNFALLTLTETGFTANLTCVSPSVPRRKPAKRPVRPLSRAMASRSPATRI